MWNLVHSIIDSRVNSVLVGLMETPKILLVQRNFVHEAAQFERFYEVKPETTRKDQASTNTHRKGKKSRNIECLMDNAEHMSTTGRTG